MERYDLHSIEDESSILVISHKGRLRKLICPFRVLCVESAGTLHENTWYFVQAVGISKSGTCFYIQRKYYVYSCFHIYVMS
jgi:hypothetical protein